MGDGRTVQAHSETALATSGQSNSLTKVFDDSAQHLAERCKLSCRGAGFELLSRMAEPADEMDLQGGLSEQEKRNNVIRLAFDGQQDRYEAFCRALADWGVAVLDAQVENPHLASLGAGLMARADYLRWLERPTPAAAAPGSWVNRFPVSRAVQLA